MSQNKSHAVMQQRSEPHDSLDDFPTPPWSVRALMEHVIPDWGTRKLETVWEPACNRGYMSRTLAEYFGVVYESDVHYYGTGVGVQPFDFLIPGLAPWEGEPIDWVITNPPFRLAEQFIERARDVATDGVAMIVRSAFLEGVGRYERLFSKFPPSIIAQFSERVPMVKGRYDPTASTATSYTWLVWIAGETNTSFVWIPPCRKDLERPGDANA